MNSNMRKAVFFVIVVGVALVAYQFMIKPANDNLTDARSRVKDKIDKLNELKEQTNEQDLKQQLAQLKEAIKFFESKLPPTNEIHTVLKNVTVIAQKEGLTPTAIKTMKVKNNSGYIEQPLKMTLVGNFNSFYSFLLELENLPRIMKVRELDMEKQKELEGQIEADMVVSIFFQNNPA